jgi:nucleoid DNA-binding protein
MGKKNKAAKKSAPKCKCNKDRLLKAPAGKGYTKSALYAHLAAAASCQCVGDVTKKQVVAVIDELVKVMIKYAPVGASLPGLGKLVLKKTPKRPAREGRNPATGEIIMLPPKPAGRKLVFRVSKVGKVAAGLA